MNTTISLTAHFDGEQILLDEPFEIEPNAKLIVTVLPDDEREAWRLAAKKNLARAFGDDEPEYELDLIKKSAIPNMKEADVVLALLPQADGTLKRRPAIVLREIPPFRDLLVCGISTQLYHEVENFDELIAPPETDFVSSGSKIESLIRLGFLAVLSRKDIIGSIGSISAERHQRLLKKLSDYLTN